MVFSLRRNHFFHFLVVVGGNSAGGWQAKLFVGNVQLPGGVSGGVFSLAVKVPSSGHSSKPAGYSSPAWIPRKSAGKELRAARRPAVQAAVAVGTHGDRKQTLCTGEAILGPLRCHALQFISVPGRRVPAS